MSISWPSNRSLSFGRAITDGILGGEKDIYKLACEAHVRYLKPHQPWFVQKMFGVSEKCGLDTSTLVQQTAKLEKTDDKRLGMLECWMHSVFTTFQVAVSLLKDFCYGARDEDCSSHRNLRILTAQIFFRHATQPIIPLFDRHKSTAKLGFWFWYYLQIFILPYWTKQKRKKNQN